MKTLKTHQNNYESFKNHNSFTKIQKSNNPTKVLKKITKKPINQQQYFIYLFTIQR